MKRQPGNVTFTKDFHEGINDYKAEKTLKKWKWIFIYKRVALQGAWEVEEGVGWWIKILTGRVVSKADLISCRIFK